MGSGEVHVGVVAPRAAEDGEGDAGGADGAFVDFIAAVWGEETLLFCLVPGRGGGVRWWRARRGGRGWCSLSG